MVVVSIKVDPDIDPKIPQSYSADPAILGDSPSRSRFSGLGSSECGARRQMISHFGLTGLECWVQV